MAAKKKPVSAAQVRKAEEAGKAKYKSGAGRTDAKGNKGMGASKSNSPKPGFYTTGQRTSSKLDTAQNLARSVVTGGLAGASIGSVARAAGNSARLAVGTEKMVRRMAKESGIKSSKITSKPKKK